MAPLPIDRITRADAFDVIGVDFAGPLLLRARDISSKAFITLFTCAVTRAVHLELVSNMTCESFLQAFRRFIARRGHCRCVYSDNALSFKKSAKELHGIWSVIKNPEVQDYLATNTIQWKFIVERAPWWGGFYERLIRSVKVTLRKVIGRKSLNFESLTTILAEVEAVLNSRPLTFVYNEPEEPAPLTPSSFLIGKRLTSLPLPTTSELVSSVVTLQGYWKKRQARLEEFWKRWSQEYITELKSASWSKITSTVLRVGQAVLIIDKDRPRLAWKMGLIEEVFPGSDGKVRACSIRLNARTVIKRPIQLLCPLEVQKQN